MNLLSIGLTSNVEEIRTQLQTDCKILTEQGFPVVIETYPKGAYTFLYCNVTGGELSFRNCEYIQGLVKNKIAATLADVIVYRLEYQMVDKIICDQYHYFDSEERMCIFDNACGLLNTERAGNLPRRVTRYQDITEQLSQYLDNHHELVLDGFLRFRLKDYFQELNDIVDKAVDDYMMEREYKEFIRLLKYFVDIHEPRVDTVHVVMEKSGGFKLLDSQGKVINNQYLEGIIVNNNNNEINYEDLLVSALITIAPNSITLHLTDGKKAQEAVKTIQCVFDGRVSICKGCSLCRTERSGKLPAGFTVEVPVE